MSLTDPTLTDALVMTGVVFGGCAVTYFLGKVYGLFYTILSYWELRLQVDPALLKRAFNAYEYNAPCSLLSALPAFTILWPLGLIFMIFATPVLISIALWKRWFRNIFKYKKIGGFSLLPSWISWNKLSEIVNRL